MIISFLYIALFYLFCLAFSFIGFPFTYLIFEKLKDKGFAFTKLISILLLSFLVWYLSITTRIEYSFATIVSLFFAILLLSIYIYKKNKHSILVFIKENSKLLLFEEILFLIFFLIFIGIRFGNPDLWHPIMGGEKPMDFAFINAMVRTKTLPPYDPWFSGEKINYYYFGQFITATLIKFTYIPSRFFYNIFLSYLFAQSALGIFTLLNSLTKSKKGGLLGSFFLLGIGNLGQVPVILRSFSTLLPINAWYWTSTRIMPNSEINEFPFFTFLYADLHSHLVSLPIVLFLIAVCYQLVLTQSMRKIILLSAVSGILLGLIRMTNAWDYPTYSLFTIILILFWVIAITKEHKLFMNIVKFIFLTAVVFATSTITALPFLSSYKTGALGISMFYGPFTRFSDYLIIHGFFIFILISFCFYKLCSFSLRKISRKFRLILLVPFVLFLASLLAHFYFVSFLFFLLLLLTIVSFVQKNTKEELLIILIFGFAIFLTVVPDIIDFKLGLGRMNTVFKFYFQAWLFFAIGSSFAFFTLAKKLQKRKILSWIWITTSVILFIFSFSYLPTATFAKIIDRMSPVNELTLDGEEYMKKSIYLDNNHIIELMYDHNAIDWINKNITGDKAVLEANTPIYRWGSRISVYTGLPTVLGWDWHEIAHRQYLPPQIIRDRASDIKTLYESYNSQQTFLLLNKYNVKYIFLGQLEKAYYDTQGIENIIIQNPKFFKKVYMNPQSKIYLFSN